MESSEQLKKEAPGVSTKFYRPELDALRTLAFLLVFIHHCLRTYTLALLVHNSSSCALVLLDRTVNYTGQGFAFGVGLFLTLSAYLISTLLLIERRTTGRVDFRAFYLRRALRIWPLYFFFVALCPVFGWLSPEMAVNRPQIGSFFLFSGNWFLVFHGFNGSPLDFLWSVCVEEQFYLLWPAVIAWRGARSLLPTSMVVLAVSAATLILLGERRANLGSAVWCNTFVQFMFFAAGGLLALVFAKRVPAFGAALRALLIFGGLGLLTAAAATTHIKGEGSLPPAPLLIGYALSLAAVVAIFLGFLGAPASWVPNWLRHLGKISYGLYVFHVPCIRLTAKAMQALSHAAGSPSLVTGLKVLTPLLSLAATIAIAHMSYNLLEAPFLLLKSRFTVVRSPQVYPPE